MATEPSSERPEPEPEHEPPEQDHAAAPTNSVDLTDTMNAMHWCSFFGVTREQLEQAVAAVGESEDAVREYLQSRRR